MMGGGKGGHGGKGGQGGMGGMMGNQDMMQMMMRMHGRMMGGMGGGKSGGMGMMGAQGGMGGSGMMGGADIFKSFDADGDGKVSPEEIRAGLDAQLEKYDADGNGSLSIAEFEALHSAAIREMMVDRFQTLDNDGDGQVTKDEIGTFTGRMGGGHQGKDKGMGGDKSDASSGN